MLTLAANWSASTISSLATGAGTLVLAIATFASVRSANRSARVAEEALLEQRRPVLAPSRFDDPIQKIMFAERYWVRAEGGRAAVEHVGGRVYLAVSLRNVGAGIGVCQGWAVTAGTPRAAPQHLPDAEFRAQTRDLYVPAGDLGMWQGAMRDPDEPAYLEVAAAIDAREPVMVELLYSDQVGEQRTITRFGLVPYQREGADEVTWNVSVIRHWFLDRPGPRAESEIQARAEQIMRRIEGDRAAEAPEESEIAESASPEPEPEPAETVEGEAPQPADGARPQEDEGERISVITRPNCE